MKPKKDAYSEDRFIIVASVQEIALVDWCKAGLLV